MELESDVFLKGEEKTATESESKMKNHSRCLVFLVCLVAVLMIAVIGLTIIIIIEPNQPETDKDAVVSGQQQSVCVTSECARTATRVLDAMDPDVDPCDDFYQYACGAWMRKHVIPEEEPTFSVFNILTEKSLIVKRYLLENEDTYEDFEAVQKAKDMYQSCTNTELIDTLGNSPVVTFLEELGGWPVLGSNPGGNWDPSTFNLVHLLIKINLYNYSPLLNIYVSSDVKNTVANIISLDEPSFGMPSRDYFLQPELADKRLAYLNLAVGVAVQMGANISQAMADMTAMAELETEIASITMRSEDRTDLNAIYNKVTLKEVKDLFPEPSPSDEIQFSWSAFVKGLMSSDLVKVAVNDSEPIVIASTPFFEKIMATLQKYDKRTITNYAMWIPIQSSISSLGSSYMELMTTYRQILFGTGSLGERWQTCLSTTTSYFPMSVSHMFVRETFQGASKTDTLEMINGLQYAFGTILEDVPWMDDVTRPKAEDKANSMARDIGYPDNLMNETYVDDLYKNFETDGGEYFWNKLRGNKAMLTDQLATLRQPIDKQIWIGDMSAINAFYNHLSNKITFPAGILQPPFYNKGQPKAMNYGGIGVVIGHEITHGFDNKGRQFDKDGNLAMWWNEAVTERFKEQTSCIIDQYSNFTLPEAGIKMNGVTTQSENIADNGGIKQSYMAYREWVTRRGAEEDTLPGVNLSPNQLFFVSFAQLSCSISRPEFAVYSVNTDDHSPGRFRVTGTLQNSPDFARVFQCANNTYMNPANKCSVW